ncbi:MAG: hypothetical protein R3D71_03750 [Rickettsiales bacterium]
MPDIYSDFGLRPVIACEIEFYIFANDGQLIPDSFLLELSSVLSGNSIDVFSIEQEKGKGQYEVAVKPNSDITKIISDINKTKSLIAELVDKHSLRADFSAKPLPDDYGSGLHIHIHLEDDAGVNQFHKKDEYISNILKYSIAGLLLWLPDTMWIFAPYEQSYNRFVAGRNAPVNISWAANNRTTALRLPDSSPDNKRIEHRVAGTDADIAKVIEVILASIHYGLENKPEITEQIYGDASLPMYNLPLFPKSLEEARQRFSNSSLPFTKYGIK